jgi:hypothetical protein
MRFTSLNFFAFLQFLAILKNCLLRTNTKYVRFAIICEKNFALALLRNFILSDIWSPDHNC